MKSEELMVGDWVYCGGQPTPDNVIIQSIHEDGVCFQGEGFMGAASYGRIFPIRLTPEILEKIGFIVKHPESAKRTYWRDRAGQIVGHKNRGLMYMEISGNPVKFGYFLPHFSGHIQFVHELQHALRLCGIDKTIEL